MQHLSPFKKYIAIACSLSIVASPTLAATSVYKVYIPELHPATSTTTPLTTPTANPALTSAIAPLTASKSALSFTTYPQTPIASTTTLTNTSLSPVHIAQGSFAQPDTSLSTAQDTCSNQYLQPNESCTLSLLFSPSTAQPPSTNSYAFTLFPSSSIPTTFSLPLSTATNIPPSLASTIALPPTIANSQYTFNLASLSSTNPVPATWDHTTALPNGLTLANNTLTGSLPPGQYTFTLQRSQGSNPTTTTPHILTLSSLSPSATLTPDATTPLTTSPNQPLFTSYTLTNTGSVSLYTPALSLAPTTSSSLTTQPSCPTFLLPTKSCTIALSYTPTTTETGSTSLNFPLLTPTTTTNQLPQTTPNGTTTPLLNLGSIETPLTYSTTSSFVFSQPSRQITTTLPTPLAINLADQLLPQPTSPPTWTLSNPLPPGLTLNPSTGQLTGAPPFLSSPWTGSVTATTTTGLATQDLTISTTLHNVQVSSASLNFGTVQTDTAQTLSYLVLNTGTFAETIGTPYLYGDVAHTLTTNCPTTLQASQSCSVQVTFSPTASSSSVSSSYIQFLLNTPTPPLANSSFSLIPSAFAATTTTSPVPTVTITAFASTSASLSIPPQEPVLNEDYILDLSTFFSGVTSSATWAADTLPAGLALNNTTGVISGVPTTLPSGGSSSHAITLSYRSSPLLPLQRLTATLTLNFKDYSWTLSKSNLDFSTLAFENQSAKGWTNFQHTDQTTITNTGNQPLTVSSATIPSADKTTIATFATLTNNPTQCTSTLAPAQSCTLTYSYTPTTPHAPLSSTITLSSARYTKTFSLSLESINPLNLTPQTFPLYRNTYNSIPLNPLLSLGKTFSTPTTPSAINWALTPQSPTLPSSMTLNPTSHTIEGIPDTAAAPTTITLSAQYAQNTNTAPITLQVMDAVLVAPLTTDVALWQSIPVNTTLTLRTPSTNTAPVSVQAVRILSKTHPNLVLTPSTTCATVAPSSTCTLTIAASATPTDPTLLGLQQATLFIDHTINGVKLSTPTTLRYTIKNPLSLSTPAPLSLLSAHPMTALDFSALASYLPTPSLNTDAFTWTLSDVPAGLTFNPTTQQLSGTPTATGTYTSTLTIAYQGATLSVPLSITVKAPTIQADTAALDFGTLYQGTITSKTTTFTLPNGGNITALPVFSLPANLTTSSTTCTTGLKAPAYACAVTATVKPSFTEEKLWTTSATLSVLGNSATTPLSFTVANPLSLPAQETWQLLADQPQSLEQFSALLQDARGSPSAITWAITSSNPSANPTISTAGAATLAPPVGQGTFTITATRNGATISKTYAYNSLPWPLTTTTTTYPGYYGYTTSPITVQILTNTSTATLTFPSTAPSITDLDPNDKLTYALSSQSCSSSTLPPAATCALTLSTTSQDTTSIPSFTTNTRFNWVPQPLTKATRSLSFMHSASKTTPPLTHPLSWLPIPLQYASPQTTLTIPLSSFPVNAAKPTQTYTWSATNLPAGLTINPTTGVISGSTSVPAGTYTISPTISYASPTGTTLTSSTSFSLQVINLSVSSTLLDFGLVYHDQPLTQSITLTNNGTVPATINSLTFPPSPYGILTANTSTCPSIAVNGSCTITVTLQPGSYGVLTTTAAINLSFKSLSATSTLPISATILNPLSLNTNLPSAYQSTPYSVNINSTLSHHSLGNNLSPVVWTASAMPAGWTLSSTGTLSGTPTTLSSLTFPVTAQYATYTVSGTYTLVVNPLSISTPFLLDFGAVYSRDTAHTLSATLTNTSSTTLSYIKPILPSSATDLSISSNTCTTLAPAASCQITLSFNPTTPNPLYASTLTINYGITTSTHTTVLPITAQVNNPLNLTTNLPSPIVGLPFSYSLSTNLTSALEPINPALATWTLSSALPAGITFNPSTGILSGTAAAPEALNLVISASYKGNTIASSFPFATTQHLLLIQPPLTDLGTLYQGDTPTPITLTLTNASYRADTSAAVSLPFLAANPLQIGTPTPDLTITSTTCTTSLLPAKSCTVSLSLNPATITSHAIAVSASAGVAPATTAVASATITAAVVNPLQLASANLPTLAENITTTLPFQPYLSHALQPLVPPVATWTSTPLPAGLVLNATTGKIAGVPTVHGNYTFTLTATTKTNAASQTYELKIVNPGVQLSTPSLDFGAVPTNWETSVRTITATNSTDFAQQISYSISTATNPYLLPEASSTCTSTLAPHTSCQWTWRYAPTTASQNLLNNFAVSATVENFTVLQRATFVGTTFNPLALSDTLPQAFVGVPFSYPLHTNLSASTTTNLNLAGLDWTGSNYRVNPTTGIVAFTPTSINPVVFSAKATLRGNSISRTYTITPIATSFALTASPSPIDLGTVYINHVPASATVTLTNPGSYSAEITAAPYFSSSTAEHPFTITASTCPAALNPGMSCTITFQYAPTMAKSSVATTLIVPVGKNGATLTKTSVPVSASALQPLAFSSALQQPIVGIPYSYNFNTNITSAIEPITAPSLTWTVDAGSLPSGLTFNKGLVSGTPTATTAASITLTAYYKNNRITQTFVYTPTQISATQTPPASDLGIVYPGTAKSTTFTLQNTSTNQNLTIEAPPALSAATPYTSISFNSCTAGRTLLPLTACSIQVTFTPTAPTNPLSVSLKTGVGYRGTITQWLQTSVSMDSDNSMSWSPVPTQTLSQSFPTSIDLRPFLNVVNIPNLSRANIVWTTSGSLPAGLTFSQGIISGTPTTLQATNFQVSAAYAGNSSTSNTFTLQVVEPVVFVPPPASPPLFASSLNPANMGPIFVEQAKTMTTSWRVNVPSTITATPYIQTSPNGITISSHTCAPVGTVVPAGYSCQATVQLKGLSTNIGNRSSKVVMGVGARTTTYSTASAYVAGSVLNPFVVYPQETILSLAPNTPLVPVSDFYVDRFPSGTPVTVSLRSAIDYNDPNLPFAQRYPSASLPARLTSGYITSGSVDGVQASFDMIMTITKHTSPTLTIEQPFVLKMRKSSNFAVTVQSQQGQFAGYPANTTTYKITNNHPVDITPTYGESFWTDTDFNPFDSITSTSTTDCIRNLPVQASCTYTRTVNPGTAEPNAVAAFGASRAFIYAPQPTTKPTRKTTAMLYSTIAPGASSAGSAPNHFLTQMASAHKLAEPVLVQDGGFPTMTYLDMRTLVVCPSIDYLTQPFSVCSKKPNADLATLQQVSQPVRITSLATGQPVSGQASTTCPIGLPWALSYENGYVVARVKPHEHPDWATFASYYNGTLTFGYCTAPLNVKITLPSGRVFSYTKTYPSNIAMMSSFKPYGRFLDNFSWSNFYQLPLFDINQSGAYGCRLHYPAGSSASNGSWYSFAYGSQCESN